jgi:pilus assembly protein CpaE
VPVHAATEKRIVRSALISTDTTFREAVKRVVQGTDRGITLDLELGVPLTGFGDEQLRQIRTLEPDLIFLDLESDPVLGTKLAQFLADANPGQRFIAAGPLLLPEQLMAAMRAGISEYLTKPVDAAELTEAVDRAAHKLGWAPGTKSRLPGHVYSFFSAKGGSGSTTVAANTAIMLHRLTGKRTLLLDLDLELGEAALLLGMQPRFNFVDLVQNFHRMDAGLLSSYIEHHDSGIDLLSAPYHPEKAEPVSGDQIRRILQFLRQHYEYVVVDTSKSFSQSTLATFEQSDLVFLVTTVDLSSLRNIQRGLPMLKRMLPRGQDQIRLVINRYNRKDAISLEDVKRTIGLSPYWTLSNDYDAVLRSVNDGKPIVLNGTSQCTKDLKAFAAAVAGVRDKRGAGLGLGRMFDRLRSRLGTKQAGKEVHT